MMEAWEIREAHREAWGYDYTEVWGYADGSNIQGQKPEIHSVDGADPSPFGPADLAEEVGRSDGVNDGDEWLLWGHLKDGRWFLIEAGCDYTGWDCQAGGRCWVAMSADALIRGGMGDEQRRRLKVEALTFTWPKKEPG